MTISYGACALSSGLIIIIIINCNWVATRWQRLFYMYTKYEIGYLLTYSMVQSPS